MGNLTSAMDVSGTISFAYDALNRATAVTNEDGTTTGYIYDANGKRLSIAYPDGKAVTTAYDALGNVAAVTDHDGTFTYTYNAQNKLVKGENADGESSSYTYNALGIRIENVQVRENQNAGNQNADLKDGSHGTDYLPFLSDLRATWQRAWETEIGTVVQNDFETVTKHYVADYLSPANRDILVTEDGSFTQRYVYDADGKRLSVELGYADGTARATTNVSGEYGENPQSDIAASIGKAWYRTSHLNSTLFAVEADGSVVAHMIYDPWGKPLLETYTDTNYSGLDNLNNFTGYAWNEVLGMYYAQNRFYDAATQRFTQEDAIKDGGNWYAYCGNDPLNYTDPNGLWTFAIGGDAAAAFGFGINAGAQIAIDDNYNMAILWNGAFQAGTPNASLGGAVSFSNADTVFDLSGQSYSAGGSAGLAVTGGLEFAYGTARDGASVITTSISAGVGPIPAELHANFFAGTAVTEIRWRWLYNKVRNLADSTFEKLSCEQKEAIRTVIGDVF